MKMQKNSIIRIIAAMVLMLCITGCGNRSESISPEEMEPPAVITATQEVQEPEEAIELESEYSDEEDKNKYGNTIGNIYNSGYFIYSHGVFYFVNSYEGALWLTASESGISTTMLEDSVIYLNFLDDRLYCLNSEGAIVVMEVYEGTTEVLREGGDGAFYLQVVNDNLYYTDGADNTFRTMSAYGGEEEILINEEVYFPVVYKDKVIFQRDSDGESLYSMPLDGGEMTKLNDIRSYSPMIYQDKIYYLAVMDDESIMMRVMNLDGSDDQVLFDDVIPDEVNLYEGCLYFTDIEDLSKIYCLDLTDEDAKPVDISPEDALKRALKEAYGEDIFTEFEVISYEYIDFSGDYMIFFCETLVDGSEYLDEYIYDMANDEVIVIPVYCMDFDALMEGLASMLTEDLISESDVQKSEASTGAGTVSTSSEHESASSSGRTSYPAGDYSVGSVYGPNLSQAQLDDVASAVETFLSMYDTASMDDYTKVLTAHDYLCNICEYAADWSQNNANSAWGALIYHEAQCSGYARAMKALCDAMGVGCYYVHADASASNPSHQWNICSVNGNWYIVDVQCNDSSGFRAFFLVSDDTYANATGMSWDRSSVPACPADY